MVKEIKVPDGQKVIIKYDINSKPEGLNWKDLIIGFTTTGLLLYDSELGEEPEITSIPDTIVSRNQLSLFNSEE